MREREIGRERQCERERARERERDDLEPVETCPEHVCVNTL